MKAPRNLPKGRKVRIAWTSKGRRKMGTCWWWQAQDFIDGRILPGSTDVILRVEGTKRKVLLGDKV